MDSPLNVATPVPVLTATVLVPLRVPPGPALVWIASVTSCAVPVTVLPPASCSVTAGCVLNADPNADPPVPFPGCVVNANFDAAPTVTLKELLSADVSEPSVALST